MQVRLIEAGDPPACNAFHNRLYGTRRTDAQWAWEFGAGRDLFAVVEDGGEILGTQALMPITMIDERGEFPTAKSEETLLDPALRGMNMFGRMYELLFERAQTVGIRAIWGFTSAVKPFEKVGFTVPAQTSQLFFPVSSRALGLLAGSEGNARSRALRFAFAPARAYSLTRLAAGRRPVAGVRLETLDAAPAEAGELSRRFIGLWGGTTIHRDEPFLRWRLFANPYLRPVVRAAYQGDALVGWIAYATDNDSMGYIVDVMAAPTGGREATPSVVRMLLRDATIALQRMGALGIRAWTVTRHPFDRVVVRAASRLGFYRIGRGEPMVLRLMSGAADGSMRDIDNWYITRIYTQGLAG
jgi:hypothetical protein